MLQNIGISFLLGSVAARELKYGTLQQKESAAQSSKLMILRHPLFAFYFLRNLTIQALMG